MFDDNSNVELDWDRSAVPTKNAAFLTGSKLDNSPRCKPGDRFHHLFSVHDSTSKVRVKNENRTAIEFENEKFSFSNLDALANQIARLLIKLGATQGDRIALLLDRTIHAYASVLAVSKIDCTFVPLDASFPADRVAFICGDSDVKFALTNAIYADIFVDTKTEVISLDEASDAYNKLSTCPPKSSNKKSLSDDVCYIIYTSGTTGNPKGVPIKHSSICNFLKVAAAEYGFEKQDRVFQSLTLAFDYSFEEIWVPLICGARLIPAPIGVNLLGEDLTQFLTEKKVSAWCSVPTVLATIEEDLPDLRLLIVSGEACPDDLVEKWKKPERRFLNVYGPTEATVSATWKVLEKGESVTIGHPLPTYTAMVLCVDSNTVLDCGEEGELALAGIGLAQGYLNRDTETKKAFIEDFIGIENNPDELIYRTGDLALINEKGEIEYRGRVDTQVKIRGYRIELSEIEAAAREISNLQSIVVNPVKSEEGEVELALYYVCQEKESFDEKLLHEALRKRLPPYMVPTYYEYLEDLPLLPSQKINRKQLPPPTSSRAQISKLEFVNPSKGLESNLAKALEKLLNVDAVSANSNFFTDLGANSLIMARFLGAVRRKIGISASMKLIYQNATIQKLAQAISAENKGQQQVIAPEFSIPSKPISNPFSDENIQHEKPSDQTSKKVHSVSRSQYVFCAIMQLVWLLILGVLAGTVGMMALKWILFANGAEQIYYRSVITIVGMFVGTVGAQLAIKWLVIGRFKEEIIPVWTLHYVRFWIAQLAVRTNPMVLFVGTPVYNIYLRLLGAKVGKGTLVFSPPPTCTDLISIGQNTVIRQSSVISGYTARSGKLHLGPVKIGSGCYLGEASLMDIGSELGDKSQLGNRSALHENQKAKPEKRYLGSPAIIGDTDFIRVPEEDISPARGWSYALGLFLFAAIISGPILMTAFVLSAKYFITEAQFLSGNFTSGVTGLHLLGVSIGLYLSAILFGILRVSAMPKIWNIFFKPKQVHKLFGFQYFLAQRIFASSNNKSLQALFGDSSLIVPFFKLVGYDLKKLKQNGSNFGVEQSHHSPFLCEFNDNTFVSDGLAMINTDLSRTSFKLSKITFPKAVYLGNDLHYPTGARVGENCLIATKALVPLDGEIRTDVGILGSPPFEIPRSKTDDAVQVYEKQDETIDHRLWLKLKSNLITIGLFMFRNWSMQFFGIIVGFTAYTMFAEKIFASSLFAGSLIAGIGLAMLLIRSFYNILFERATNWHRPVKPINCSLYERQFWNHERYWKLSLDPVRETFFAGTPIKNLISICQGVKMGKQVFDNGCSFPDPVLVSIGDHCTLNHGSVVQGHSLEDGMFKADNIEIGDTSTLGVSVFVHYGTDIGKWVDIRSDAFVMKGAVIENNEVWTGNPAQPMTQEQDFKRNFCDDQKTKNIIEMADLAMSAGNNNLGEIDKIRLPA